MPWTIGYQQGWDTHFKKMDSTTQKQILKKIDQMKQPLQGRGLNRNRYLVEESGQNRIAYDEDAQTRTKKIHFVGNHKQYEKWLLGINK